MYIRSIISNIQRALIKKKRRKKEKVTQEKNWQVIRTSNS